MTAQVPVAIFGGMGYLGQALYARLNTAQIPCWIIGRQSAQENAWLPQADYRSAQPSLEQAVANADAVFHLATVTTPAMGEKKPELDLENISLTLNLAEACAKARVRHLIFASSGGTLYGNLSVPASEDVKPHPICSYGIAKLASENYLQLFARRTGIHITILRISNAYGGNQMKKGEQGVIGYMRRQIQNAEPVHLYGDTVRDYIFIDDIVDAFLLSLRRPDGVRILNISTGVETRLADLASRMYSLMGKKEQIVMGERRPFDLAYNVLKNDRAQAVLGWRPNYSLESGLGIILHAR